MLLIVCQMYSCGSLAPKMRRGGCMDTHFQKPAEPWEKTEGSVLQQHHTHFVFLCTDLCMVCSCLC